MTKLSARLLRFARWIAGNGRAEWIDAMESEAASMKGNATSWAAGAVYAAMVDRLARERALLAAILLLPIGAYLLELALFFPISWLVVNGFIPGWLMIASLILLTLVPLGFVLGRIRPGMAAYLAAPWIFVGFHLIPMTIFWIEFRNSPQIWFDKGATIYMLPPFVGFGVGMAVVLAGVWLGSHRLKSG